MDRRRYSFVSNDYTYSSYNVVQTYCGVGPFDFNGSKTLPVSCKNWDCSGDPDRPDYYEWWFSRLPGRELSARLKLHAGGKRLRNFWDLYEDFDAYLSRGKNLFE
jgi:hypothetical protein